MERTNAPCFPYNYCRNPHLINVSNFAHKYVFLFSILCLESLILFLKTNRFKSIGEAQFYIGENF